jgi:hypothetical protein
MTMKSLIFQILSTLSLAMTVLVFEAQATVLNIVQTDITGAQSTLSIDNSYAWDFTVAGPMDFTSIVSVFELKRGSKTSQPAVLTLYSANGGLTPIATGSLLTSQASQQFQSLTIQLASSTTTLNGPYYLTLTSDAPTGGNGQWFIKGDTSNVSFRDENNATISAFSGGQPVPVPEPAGTTLLLTVGGLGYGLQRRLRRSRYRKEHSPSSLTMA